MLRCHRNGGHPFRLHHHSAQLQRPLPYLARQRRVCAQPQRGTNRHPARVELLAQLPHHSVFNNYLFHFNSVLFRGVPGLAPVGGLSPLTPRSILGSSVLYAAISLQPVSLKKAGDYFEMYVDLFSNLFTVVNTWKELFPPLWAVRWRCLQVPFPSLCLLCGFFMPSFCPLPSPRQNTSTPSAYRPPP